MEKIPNKELTKALLVKGVPGIILIAATFFLPRWSLNYWQAWVFMGCLLLCMTLTTLYLLRNDPKLLERRLRSKEKVGAQKKVILLSLVFLLPAYLLPGLDVRFGWSHIPAWVCILGDLLFILGYSIFFLVLRENSYASRVIEVEEGQKVISSGPYAVVRHTMYVGVALTYVSIPIALGSYWAIIPALLMMVVIVLRIRNEELVLSRDLPGYTEYLQKVKYRLIPGIW